MGKKTLNNSYALMKPENRSFLSFFFIPVSYIFHYNRFSFWDQAIFALYFAFSYFNPTNNCLTILCFVTCHAVWCDWVCPQQQVTWSDWQTNRHHTFRILPGHIRRRAVTTISRGKTWDIGCGFSWKTNGFKLIYGKSPIEWILYFCHSMAL